MLEEHPRTDEYLTASELAARYKVTTRTVWIWAARGVIPSRVLGGSTRFLASEIEEWERSWRRG
jgi:excisionase family DNA binding protein